MPTSLKLSKVVGDLLSDTLYENLDQYQPAKFLITQVTDYGHPMKPFFILGLGFGRQFQVLGHLEYFFLIS